MLFEKQILNETKNHNPPSQVKWSVPYKKVTEAEEHYTNTLVKNSKNYRKKMAEEL